MIVDERLTPINHESGRQGQTIAALILHVTDGATLVGAVGWFHNPANEASAHYVVGPDGHIVRVVREADTARANDRLARPNMANPIVAGWARTGLNPNRATLSIEVVGRSGAAWPMAQRVAVARLIADCCRRHALPLDRTHVIGHAELDSVTHSHCPGLTAGQWASLLAEVRAIPIADPSGGFTIGAGIRAALSAASDVALGPERYLRAADGGELSFVAGRDALYLWSPDGGQVYRVARG